MLKLFATALLLSIGISKTLVNAQSCASLLPQACLAPGSSCKYDFTNNVCTSSVPTGDTCQGLTTQTTCQAGSCFWDPYLGRCLSTLYQVGLIFGCPYWGSNQFLQADPYGTGTISPACSFHGCQSNATGLCFVPATSGNIAQQQATTLSAYQNVMYFLNPTVTQNSLIAGVTVATQLVQNQNAPQVSQHNNKNSHLMLDNSEVVEQMIHDYFFDFNLCTFFAFLLSLYSGQ